MKELVPILGAVKRNRLRRELDDEKIDGWFKAKYNGNAESAEPVVTMHIWIDKYTEGRFFMSPFRVAFEDEKDYTIFSLWYKNEKL